MKRHVSLPVSIIKEHDYFVAYTPTLDFAATGDSLETAQKNFTEAINIFFEEIEEKGTLEEVLHEFGWQKMDNSLQPPEIVETKQTVELPSHV